MAVLEKIRVKMGAFITIIIALALLSFIIDPSTLESTLSMFSSKYDVGEIDGKSVTYQDYQNKVDYFTRIYEMSSGGVMNDQAQDMINNSAWQDEIVERVYIPATENAGLRLGSEELLDMSQGVDMIITGADRIASNGDFANKIGTFDKAIVAKHFGIPFYVAAPISTFDLSMKSGDEIVIEQRSQEEVTMMNGVRIAPEKSQALNPAFDVTPAELVTGFITEKGILRPDEIHLMRD